MITALAGLLAPIVGQKLARAAAWAALALIAIPIFFGLKSCYDGSVIEKAVNEANADFLAEKDEAAGEADLESEDRQAAHEARVKSTEDLIDEALEKGCAVGEYIASAGANCMRGSADPVPDAAPK